MSHEITQASVSQALTAVLLTALIWTGCGASSQNTVTTAKGRTVEVNSETVGNPNYAEPAAGASLDSAIDRPLDSSRFYPYIIPESYLEGQPLQDPSHLRPLGHGLFVTLIDNADGLGRLVWSQDLKPIALSPDEAHRRALQNLETLAATQNVTIECLQGIEGKRLILIADHWLAATCILLPSLRKLAAKSIGSTELCASIPHRGALLIFEKGTPEYRQKMRKQIEENESSSPKRLTPLLFELTETGPREFHD